MRSKMHNGVLLWQLEKRICLINGSLKSVLNIFNTVLICYLLHKMFLIFFVELSISIGTKCYFDLFIIKPLFLEILIVLL